MVGALAYMLPLAALKGETSSTRTAISREIPFGEELILREVKVGKKILVTTFLSPRSVSKSALGELFRQRWHVELDLRAIKTTLQMAELSCNTPHMNEKELWGHFLAYNLIRLPERLALLHGLRRSVIETLQRMVQQPLAGAADRLLVLLRRHADCGVPLDRRQVST